MDGLHITADLQGCAGAPALLTDTAALRALCLQAVQAAGLRAVGELFSAYEAGGGGITGVVLLAESHLAVHTWPELGAVTLDVYVCNYGQDNSAKAEQVLQALLAAFAPQRQGVNRLQRG
ncbi:MAG: adenosylmethionine decarboxylase, partial [Betaproteobacteria bacterium]|nr:adenosylmethionine decarboxylase [Betaproteobacteria bacterium]